MDWLPRGVDHDEEMASVIDDHASAAQLDIVVQNVPPDLETVADADLGSRTLVPPATLRARLEKLNG